jgi:hypothetical protein
MKERIRFYLQDKGFPVHEFVSETSKPRIGELITVKGEHYEVVFIQYMFVGVDVYNFDEILVTGIKK